MTLRRLPLLLLPLLALALSGCGRKAVRESELIWPPAPETARIRFVRTLSSAGEVERVSTGQRLRDFLFGPTPKPALAKPYAVFADGDRVYVADSGWRKIVVFDFAKKSFFMIGVDGPGLLAKPQGVAVDAAGRIYVTDTVLRRALVYDRDGRFLFGMGDVNRFELPVGIALNESAKRAYIADTRKHRISVFDYEGNFLFDFGRRGTEDGEFNFPANLFIDQEGKVYVADIFNFRIQLFDPDGKFLSKFGSVGTGLGQFALPKGVAVDSGGHIYVTDAKFHNVQIFDPKGRLLLFFGELGGDRGQFWLPAAIFIDSKDQIYVADQYNHRIDIFEYIGPKEGPGEPKPAAAPAPPPQTSAPPEGAPPPAQSGGGG